MVQSTAEAMTNDELIAKLDRRAHAQRKLAEGHRRLAEFDEEIRDALIAFRAAGGVDESAEPGGQSDGTGSDETATA